MVATEVKTDAVVVKPEGKITAANAEQFRKELLSNIESGHKNLVIDLGGVDMIDSKGLAVFIVCHKTLSPQGGQLTVVTDNPDFQGLFHVMRLDEHFVVKGSEH
jgi:anti-sigma B factor antagonist